MHFGKHQINCIVNHAGECWMRRRSSGWFFTRLTFPLYTASQTFSLPTSLRRKKAPQMDRYSMFFARELHHSTGTCKRSRWSLKPEQDRILWGWSSCFHDPGSTPWWCGTESAHTETWVWHSDSCFGSLTWFGFLRSEAKIRARNTVQSFISIIPS